LTYDVILDSLILASVQYVIMFIEFKEVLSQELEVFV